MYSFASCRRRILNLELPQEECEDIAAAGRPLYTEEDHHLFINSLFDLNCESGVRAAGSMLQFADSNSVGGVNLESRSYRRAKSGNSGGSCLVLQVKTLAVDEVVSIDETTFTALQIFSSKMQPTSGSRFGSWNKNRDGLSLFGIVNTCKSVLGAKYLRYMFRCPPRNISTILQRQDVVAFFANPAQNDLAKLLQSCLKNVKNIPRLLRKLAATQASVSDWKCLRKSIHNLIRIGEIASCERDGVSILDKLSDSVSTDLHAMAEYIERVMDIDKSKTRGRFSVNAGIDDELDQMRRVHNGLPDLLFKVRPENINCCYLIFTRLAI
jgi:DNA mismatch repair ATPase MutS